MSNLTRIQTDNDKIFLKNYPIFSKSPEVDELLNGPSKSKKIHLPTYALFSIKINDNLGDLPKKNY